MYMYLRYITATKNNPQLETTQKKLIIILHILNILHVFFIENID